VPPPRDTWVAGRLRHGRELGPLLEEWRVAWRELVHVRKGVEGERARLGAVMGGLGFGVSE
jgi:hypothetical protein